MPWSSFNSPVPGKQRPSLAHVEAVLTALVALAAAIGMQTILPSVHVSRCVQ